MEKNHFLAAFLLKRSEVLLVGIAYKGENGDGRLYDVTQGEHLAGF